MFYVSFFRRSKEWQTGNHLQRLDNRRKFRCSKIDNLFYNLKYENA
jgi:hypothetical protein